MFNLQTAELLVSTITFLIAYFVVVTIAGSFRAWVAEKMGDTTAYDLGFLTLNPAMHIDLFGLFFLIFFRFGWGRYVPVNYFNMTGRWQRLKQAFSYFSDTIAHVSMALAALIILLILFDEKVISIVRYMILMRDHVSHLPIATIYPNHSSTIISIATILIASMYLNVVLGVLGMIINGWNWFMFVREDRDPYNTKPYGEWARFLVPIVLILLFSGPLRLLIINIITYVGYALAYVLNII